MGLDDFGIAAIGGYLPADRQDNVALASRFEFADDFLATKLGVIVAGTHDGRHRDTPICVSTPMKT